MTSLTLYKNFYQHWCELHHIHYINPTKLPLFNEILHNLFDPNKLSIHSFSKKPKPKLNYKTLIYQLSTLQ
jgi:hypothetical protein